MSVKLNTYAKNIIKREGNHCLCCDIEFDDANPPSIHHLQPREQGGSDDPDNLVALCQKCHDRIEQAQEAAVLGLNKPLRRNQLAGIFIEEMDVNENESLEEVILTPQFNCRQFDSCDAPLCPLDKSNYEHGIWYPDEDICHSMLYGGNKQQFIKTQRKIANRVKDKTTYFTFAMLNRNIGVHSTTIGINPDGTDETAQINAWLKNHIGSKPLTDTERQRRRETINAARGFLKNRSSGTVFQGVTHQKGLTGQDLLFSVSNAAEINNELHAPFDVISEY